MTTAREKAEELYPNSVDSFGFIPYHLRSAFLAGWNAAIEAAAERARQVQQGPFNGSVVDNCWEWTYNRDVVEEIRALKETR